MIKPKVAFLIRGHVRGSCYDRLLNDFILESSKIADIDVYIQTWNTSESKNSWRDTSAFEFRDVKDSDIYDYFDKSIHKKIKNLLIFDESEAEIFGNKKGNIGDTLCPTIGWKYMWFGIYENIASIPRDHNYDLVLDTRFDIFNENLDKFCRRPRHKKWLMPLSHIDFLKKMINLLKSGDLKGYNSIYDRQGCDNFVAGKYEDMLHVINSFHFHLDDIIPEWIKSNFLLKHQEQCVKWFAKTHRGYHFFGDRINPDDFQKLRKEWAQ